MDALDRINEVLATLRQRAIARAAALDPSITAQVEADQHEIAEHDRRLEAQRQPAPPPQKVKTQEQLDAEKQEREIQSRVRRALADLEAERQAAAE